MAASDFDRVRYIASNSHADYFKVDDAYNVIVQAGGRVYCLDCRSAACKHVALVQEHGDLLLPPEGVTQ